MTAYWGLVRYFLLLLPTHTSLSFNVFHKCTSLLILPTYSLIPGVAKYRLTRPNFQDVNLGAHCNSYVICAGKVFTMKRAGRVDDLSFFEYLSPFCFL